MYVQSDPVNLANATHYPSTISRYKCTKLGLFTESKLMIGGMVVSAETK